LSLQLPIVGLPLLVDHFKACDFVLHFLKPLSQIGCLLANSGDKPKGCGSDGGADS
jgi:hypothetical protein